MSDLGDIEHEIKAIADGLDDADGTKFGDMPQLLDKLMKHAQAALNMIEQIEQERLRG